MQSTLVNGLGELPNENDVRVPVCTWNSCVYTLNATEQLTRLFGNGHFHSLSSRQKECLQALVQHASFTSRLFGAQVIKQHCLTLLAALFCPGESTNQPCILEVNALSLLVGLFFSLPMLDEDSIDYLSIKPDCQEHIIWLAYTVCIVQALLTIDLEEMKEETMQTDTDVLVGSILMQLRVELSGCVVSFNGLHKCLESRVVCFLRSAALMFHCLTDIPFPDESGGPLSTEALSVYIGLPPLANVLQDINPITETGMGCLIQQWCQRHQHHLGPNGETRSIRCSPVTRLLIELPHEYFDIVERATTAVCPNLRGETSRCPALCLVCGSIVCAQSYCCATDSEGQMIGASTVHSRKCSPGVGLYLYIRECQVVLLAGEGRGCLYPAPYFDKYGETDVGLKRGNPLYLCEESYKKLQEIWLKHTLYEVVVNSMEEHPNLMGISWSHV
jgi:E3 ubiquitin-protein ligase UBR2